MKKLFPLVVLLVAALAWLGVLIFEGEDEGADLVPFATGAMATFEVFEKPKTLPEATFLTRGGETVTFEDLAGKVLLVNLWATWCEPCKEEMPTLDNLQTIMAGEGFEVVTISVDWQGYKVIDPFFEEHGIAGLTAYWDRSNRLPGQLDVIGLPLTILVDADGQWLGRVDGPLKWDSPEAVRMMRAAVGRLR